MEAYGQVVRAWGSMTDGGPCIRYGAKKIEKFFFVSYALKMILKGFWTCFEDFWFSRSPNPLHVPCIRYGRKRTGFVRSTFTRWIYYFDLVFLHLIAMR
jgi:hypothetical protein